MDMVSLTFHGYAVFAIIFVAFIFYAQDHIPMEATAMGIIAFLMLFFHLFPLQDEAGHLRLSQSDILAGFANPALMTVIALLIIGQGIATSGVLDVISYKVLALSRGQLWLAMLISLISVLVISAFLNNIPVVIIFIPIIQAIAKTFHVSSSKLLMPLSFIAVLGGMTTLVGSSTNLLVSQSLVGQGYEALGFFEFTALGVLLAVTGLIYVMVISPYLLPDRKNLSHRIRERSERYFLAEVEITNESALIGTSLEGEICPELPGKRIAFLHRSGKTYLPPFTGLILRTGDVLSLSASRTDVTSLLASERGLVFARGFDAHSKTQVPSTQITVEVMVTPSSSLIGQTIGESGFEKRVSCEVLGFRHRARMVRSRLNKVKLSAGDMILVKCDGAALRLLREEQDVVLVEYSMQELPNNAMARRATLIFVSVVICAALSWLPIVIAAVCGALAMVGSSILSLKQALRTIDVKIVTTIAAALALGEAMQETGAAQFLAYRIVTMTGESHPAITLSAFFLTVALMSNIVSTKTGAVLFVPIGLHIGTVLSVEPRIFAITVIFAANCAFVTPFAYQTSLLVMGPGSYKFKDFVKVGTPLLILVWGVFSVAAPFFFSL